MTERRNIRWDIYHGLLKASEIWSLEVQRLPEYDILNEAAAPHATFIRALVENDIMDAIHGYQNQWKG